MVKINLEQSSPSALVVPFGKHKGRTVAEVLDHDPAYVEWLTAQAWLAERFSELHTAFVSRGTVTDDTPDHNAMQVQFLDPIFCAACIHAAWGGVTKQAAEQKKRGLEETLRGQVVWNMRQAYVERAEMCEHSLEALKNTGLKVKSSVAFERRGVDVSIRWGWCSNPDDWHSEKVVNVELKPTMSEDYPTVMRQMQRLGADTLLVGSYTGRAVPEPLLRKMFAANGVALVFVRDVEAEIANVRELVWPEA